MQWSANSNISFICHCNGDVNRGQKRDVVQWVKDERECICVQFCFDLEGPEITKWEIYFRIVNNEYITERKNANYNYANYDHSNLHLQIN